MANLETAAYRIEPLPLAAAKRIEVPGLAQQQLGCALVLLNLSAAFVIVELAGSILTRQRDAFTGLFFILLTAALAGGVTLPVLRKRRAERVRALEEADLKARRETADLEASKLTNRTADLLRRSNETAEKLPACLHDASAWLTQAGLEYNEKAYSSFWDAMESAATDLRGFRDLAQQLTRDSAIYQGMLSDRTHNFPALGIKTRTLPDPTHALTEFQRLLRSGQTNFEFATIWEHRTTRDVLLAGFRNLGEAVSNLRFGVEGAVSELHQAVSSDLAQLLDEHVRTREASATQAKDHLERLDQIHKQLETP